MAILFKSPDSSDSQLDSDISFCLGIPSWIWNRKLRQAGHKMHLLVAGSYLLNLATLTHFSHVAVCNAGDDNYTSKQRDKGPKG